MAGKTKTAPKGEATLPDYPNLARFIEQVDRQGLETLFSDTRKKLDALTGAKAASAKKAVVAIEKVEGLLGEFFALRLHLEEDARKAKSTRR